jgi:capsular polysaccharide biosynthesis protein
MNTRSILSEILHDHEVEFEFIDYSAHPGFILSNFYAHPRDTFRNNQNPAKALHDYTRIYVDEETDPYRVVYLSRLKVGGKRAIENKVIKKGLKFYSDLRIDNEAELEKYFEKRGVEIIYPENFKTFKDQVRFFNEVKTVISLSGSGLTNAVFMKPGTTMIEIITPLTALVANSIDSKKKFDGEEAIHHYYSVIAYDKNQKYLGVPNQNQSAQEVINFFESHNILGHQAK